MGGESHLITFTLASTLTLTATSGIAQSHAPHNRSTPVELALLFAPLLMAPLAFRRRLAAKGLRAGRLLLFVGLLTSLCLTQFATGCSDPGKQQPRPIYTGTMQVVVTSAGTSQQVAIPIAVEAQ